MAFEPDLEEAQKNLPRVLQVLTQLSLQSTATLLVQDDCKRADSLLADYEEHLDNLSAMIRLDGDRLNPKWNKVYGDGEGQTVWEGCLRDGRDRGGIPYFCPRGWIRFSLNVCPDSDFERHFDSWGYLYHGTNSKHLGSILASGFRASKGVYCGKDDSAVYMSPSIEYCGHPRYSCIEYNPETGKWLQIVLQCRADPTALWRKLPETMRCREFGIKHIDPNIRNGDMEWLFRPEHEVAGAHYVKDAIICTGIMLRITDTNPSKLPYWWSRDPAYLRAWTLDYPIVDPSMPSESDWIEMVETEMELFGFTGNCLGSDFKLEGTKRAMGRSRMAPGPFGKGGMRFAYYLRTAEGLFTVKKYNKETLKHIREVLNISQEDAVCKEVATYLVARHFASKFNASLPEHHKLKSNHIQFLEPRVFKLREADGTQHLVFGEKYIQGNFIKWNSNAGYVNTGSEAEEARMHMMVGLFAHHTFHESGHRLMVVDIQGWQLGVVKNREIVFTDPQVHTQTACGSRANDEMYQRFSLGNLGRTGMLRFFKTHECTEFCRKMGLPPASEAIAALRPVPVPAAVPVAVPTPTRKAMRKATPAPTPTPVPRPTSKPASVSVPGLGMGTGMGVGVGVGMGMDTGRGVGTGMGMGSHRVVFLGEDTDVESGEAPARGAVSLLPRSVSTLQHSGQDQQHQHQQHYSQPSKRKHENVENVENVGRFPAESARHRHRHRHRHRRGGGVTLVSRKRCQAHGGTVRQPELS